MELKKSPKANLENKRKIFFELGLVISILICLYGFELNSGVKQVETWGSTGNQAIEEMVIPITQWEEKQPTSPPPPKVADLINIVDDNTDVKEDPDLYNTDVDSKTGIYATPQLFGQPEPEIEDIGILLLAEEMPEFPGGQSALLYYLSQHIKYPSLAVDNGIHGTVFVNFVVNKDGSISDARVLRAVDPSLDKEALRVVSSLPKWKPGKQSGKPVRVSYSVPIKFVLQ